VAAVASAVDVPVIAIGGITADRVAELRAAGAHGVAVVAAVNAAPDPYLAALELFKALGETR
jgi:thiamine-phosphate pyrophosphorylase